MSTNLTVLRNRSGYLVVRGLNMISYATDGAPPPSGPQTSAEGAVPKSLQLVAVKGPVALFDSDLRSAGETYTGAMLSWSDYQEREFSLPGECYTVEWNGKPGSLHSDRPVKVEVQDALTLKAYGRHNGLMPSPAVECVNDMVSHKLVAVDTSFISDSEASGGRTLDGVAFTISEAEAAKFMTAVRAATRTVLMANGHADSKVELEFEDKDSSVQPGEISFPTIVRHYTMKSKKIETTVSIPFHFRFIGESVQFFHGLYKSEAMAAATQDADLTDQSAKDIAERVMKGDVKAAESLPLPRPQSTMDPNLSQDERLQTDDWWRRQEELQRQTKELARELKGSEEFARATGKPDETPIDQWYENRAPVVPTNGTEAEKPGTGMEGEKGFWETLVDGLGDVAGEVGDVLKSWGGVGTAAVVGTAKAPANYLPWIIAGLGAVLLLTR